VGHQVRIVVRERRPPGRWWWRAIGVEIAIGAEREAVLPQQMAGAAAGISGTRQCLDGN